MEHGRRRVVITGLGLVTPLGTGVEKNWQALVAGRSGIGPVSRFDVSDFPTRIAGEVKDFRPEHFIEKKEIKKMDLFIQYSVAAAQMAMEETRLPITEPAPMLEAIPIREPLPMTTCDPIFTSAPRSTPAPITAVGWMAGFSSCVGWKRLSTRANAVRGAATRITVR